MKKGVKVRNGGKIEDINITVHSINDQQDSTSHGIFDILSEQELKEGKKWEDIIRLQRVYPEKIEILFSKNLYNIKTKKELEEFIESDMGKKAIDLIMFGKIENIKLFFGENGIIKTKEELEKLIESDKYEEIKDLLDYGKIENMKLFFGKEGMIKTIKEFENLVISTKWEYITYIIKEKSPENVIFYMRNYTIYKEKFSEEKISFLVQNMYIENDENILTGNYIRKKSGLANEYSITGKIDW